MSNLNIQAEHSPLFKFFSTLPKELKEQLLVELKADPINYTFNGQILGDVPNELSYLFEALDKSKYILELQDDWDDEGSPKYNPQTWMAVAKFLLAYSKAMLEDFNTEITCPVIYHAPKGSIDIIWENENYRLVVNVLANGEQAFFYADNYKDQVSEGSFNLQQFNHLLIPFAIQL